MCRKQDYSPVLPSPVWDVVSSTFPGGGKETNYMQNLFDIPEAQWKLERKVRKLRERIRAKSLELGITPEHTDQRHFYRIPKLNKVFASVSAEHRYIKDPSIRNFEKNEALRNVKNNYKNYTDDNIDEYLKKASDSGVSVRDNAGSKGNYIHDCREIYFRRWIDSGLIEKPEGSVEQIALSRNDIPEYFRNEVVSGCAGIDKFIKERNYIPIACELYVYDDRTECAGTLDDIAYVDWKLCLLDLKSSNQFKDVYTLQVMRYERMFYRLFRIKVEDVAILKTDKAHRNYDLEWFNQEQKKHGVMANNYLVKFNKHWEKIIESRKTKIITI